MKSLKIAYIEEPYVQNQCQMFLNILFSVLNYQPRGLALVKRLRNAAPTFTPRRRFPLGLKCCEMEWRRGKISYIIQTKKITIPLELWLEWVFLNKGLRWEALLRLSLLGEWTKPALFLSPKLQRQRNYEATELRSYIFGIFASAPEVFSWLIRL